MWDKGMHGPVTVNFYCGTNDTPFATKNIYIDPSGRVMQATSTGVVGSPLQSATVTLFKENSSGTWAQVANGDTNVMDPAINTKNPDTTAFDGAFGWNVMPGTYKVRAEKSGCHAPGSESQTYVETANLTVPLPIMSLELLLECPKATAPSGLNVTLSIFNNWTTGGPNGTGGYCATVNGTNNTGAALDWTATFTLPETGVIYDQWNGNFTESGNNVTVSGIDWNNILQPGQSLNSVGFCVNRGAGTPNPTTYTLTVTKAGSGDGTVAAWPPGTNCGSTCTVNYAGGTSVSLTATPAASATFAGWSGACSGSGTCTITMNSNQAVTATFTTIPSYTLTVSKAGTGSGTVTSSPAGISCGSTCSASYTSGTSVALTAAPDSGSVFAGWSGACSGTGTCTVAMSAAKAVTATFNPSAGGVTITPVINQNTTYFTEEDVKIANTASLTALKVTIVMQRASGLSYNGQYNTLASGQITQANSSTASAITYTFTLASGKTVSAGTNWVFAGQAKGTGKVHPTTGDTYTATYTTGGKAYTQTGHF